MPPDPPPPGADDDDLPRARGGAEGQPNDRDAPAHADATPASAQDGERDDTDGGDAAEDGDDDAENDDDTADDDAGADDAGGDDAGGDPDDPTAAPAPGVPDGPTRAGIAAVLGAPNAGKSTLVNRLAGAKVTIVSPKPQTTRFRVRAVVVLGRAQVVLTDTPGIFRPRRRLDRAMVAAAWGGAQDADLALLVVDARAGINEAVEGVLAGLARAPRRPPLWLVLNKTDLIEPGRLLPLAAALNERLPFAETFMVSAEKGDGLDRLSARLAAAVPEGPWLFPEDELSDLPDRMLAAEVVREQILRQTHEEVPHHATVETESFQERADGSVRVDATIYVARASQKAILIGDGGARIKEIGRRARAELAALLERRVHLFLNVKERPGWDDDRARLRAIGLREHLD